MDSVQENITVPSEISSSYSVAEIEPEKTVADAQLALMRLRAITAAYSRNSLKIMPWVVSVVLSFVAPIALFIYFTFSEFTMRIYAFIGFSIVTLLGAVFGYAVFRRNEQQKLLCEAEQMKDEIEHRLHQLEFFSEQT